MDLGQILQILWARKGIVLLCLTVTVGAAATASLLLPKTYEATASIILHVEEPDPVTGLLLPTAMTSQYVQTEVDVVESKRVAYRVIDQLNLVNLPSIRSEFVESTGGRGDVRQWLAQELLSDLTVEPARNSNVIDISFESADPDFAALLANTWVEAYIQTSLDLRIQPAAQTTAWFDRQIQDLRGRLEAARERLSDYQQESGVVATDERVDVETANLQQVSQQLVDAQALRFDAVSRRRQMEEARARGEGIDALPDIVSNALVQQLKGELVTLEARLADLAERFGRNHADYRGAVAQRDKLRAELRAEVSNVTRNIETSAELALQREDRLQEALEKQKAKVLEIKNHRDRIEMMMRDVEGYQRSFDEAFQRYADSRLESEAVQTNIGVLSEAQVPLSASSPRLIVNVILAAVVGGLLGLGSGLLAEAFDPRVRSLRDLAETSSSVVLVRLRRSGRRAGAWRSSWFRQVAAAPRPAIAPAGGQLP